MSNQVYATTAQKLFPNIMTNSWTALGQVVAAGTPTVPVEAKVLWTSLVPNNDFDVGNFTLVLGTSLVTIDKEGMFSFSATIRMESIANGVDIEPRVFARVTRPLAGQDFIIAVTQVRCVSQSGGDPAYATLNCSFVQNLSVGDLIEFYADSCSATYNILPTSALYIQRLY